jgi:hypothetical protein
MGQLFRSLPRLQPFGAEMWPLDPATILFRWENGLLLPGGPLVVVYWDTYPLSVGLSIRTLPDQIWGTAGMHYEQATTIVTFSDPVEPQVHRESAGAPISFRILSNLMNLSGWHIHFVNDCLTILALRKGSHSARLQADAETVALGVLEAGAKATLWHIPGKEMIAVGTDGASREGAKHVIGPALTTAGRNRIRTFLLQHGWNVTIDLFAADCNPFCECYASWTNEPKSEAVNAFSVPSWNQSSCVCSQVHRETAFIFPQKRMEKAILPVGMPHTGSRCCAAAQSTLRRVSTRWRNPSRAPAAAEPLGFVSLKPAARFQNEGRSIGAMVLRPSRSTGH